MRYRNQPFGAKNRWQDVNSKCDGRKTPHGHRKYFSQMILICTNYIGYTKGNLLDTKGPRFEGNILDLSVKEANKLKCWSENFTASR